MDLWTIGLIVLCAAVLLAIVYGALADRAKNKQRAAEIQAPPQRPIPQFHPDNPAPQYLSELQARRRPAEAESTALSADDRAKIAEQLQQASTKSIMVGYPSDTFITDADSSWAILDHPRVLVCAERIESIRELITILEKVILSRSALVIAAAGLSDEVLQTLEVNKIRQTLALLVIVTTDRADLESIAAATGAEVVSRTDLQASYVGVDQLGSCLRWVSDAQRSYLILSERSEISSE